MKRCIWKDERMVAREFGLAGLTVLASPKILGKLKCGECLSEDRMRKCKMYVAIRRDEMRMFELPPERYASERTKGRCMNGI